jgi:hypothetical protein
MVPWQCFGGQGKFAEVFGSLPDFPGVRSVVSQGPSLGPFRDLLPWGSLYTLIPHIGISAM